MAENSAIEWTDATVNFWWGCTKVGPGCDHCYAETWDKRTGGAHWGTGAPRRRIASAAATLARLNRQGGKRVFIQSMSDLFDNEVTPDWFSEAWMHVHLATSCHIQIVTKRLPMVDKAIARSGFPTWPRHAGLLATVCTQAEADRDVPRLLDLKERLGIPWVGLSAEPLLEPVRLDQVAAPHGMGEGQPWLNALSGFVWDTDGDTCRIGARLDWVIVGGESGPGARPMHPDWARSLRDQCTAAGVPFFFKQWGDWKPIETEADFMGPDCPPMDWGARQDFVCVSRDGDLVDGYGGRGEVFMRKVRKKQAGRQLDGRTWDQMPEAAHA